MTLVIQKPTGASLAIQKPTGQKLLITPSFTQWTPALITTALWLDAADASPVVAVASGQC